MAEIELARKDGFVDHLRAYHVLLDGDQIGEVRAGETLVYDVELATMSSSSRSTGVGVARSSLIWMLDRLCGSTANLGAC
jgi:hypothetical protein